jgi:hypothetical protein
LYQTVLKGVVRVRASLRFSQVEIMMMYLSKSQDDDIMMMYLSKSQDDDIMMMCLSKSQDGDTNL